MADFLATYGEALSTIVAIVLTFIGTWVVFNFRARRITHIDVSQRMEDFSLSNSAISNEGVKFQIGEIQTETIYFHNISIINSGIVDILNELVIHLKIESLVMSFTNLELVKDLDGQAEIEITKYDADGNIRVVKLTFPHLNRYKAAKSEKIEINMLSDVKLSIAAMGSGPGWVVRNVEASEEKDQWFRAPIRWSLILLLVATIISIYFNPNGIYQSIILFYWIVLTLFFVGFAINDYYEKNIKSS